MFSRMVLILVASGLLSSCARENQASRKPVQVELKNGGECLRHFGSELNRFFDGQMSQGEVTVFWDCSVEAIREFQRLTSGENGGDTYTPQAIRRFLYRHKFLEQPLSDELLASVMELKAVFLSGNSQSVTRDELTRLQELLMEIKGAALDLNPYLDIVFHRRHATDLEVRKACEALKKSSLRLGLWLDHNQKAYSIAQLAQFVAALKAWVNPGPDGQSNFAKLEKAVLTFGPAKTILVSGADDVIRGDDWLPLWTGVGRVLSIYLPLRHAFGADLNSGLIRPLVPESLDELAALIDDALRGRADKKIPLGEWRDLFGRLQSADLLKDPFTVENVTGAFEWFVVRGLGESFANEAITPVSVRRLRRISEQWLDLLDRSMGGTRGLPAEWERFQKVLDGSVPMEWDDEGRLTHPRRGATSWLAKNQLRLIWPFVILDWLRECYVGSKETLSEDELTGAVGEILPMLQSFGWLKTTKLTIGKRLLREADLFTLASNGDFALDLSEASRYLAFVGSGLRTSEVWLKDAELQCPGLEAACVRKTAFSPQSRALDPFPHLKQRILGQPISEFLKYMRQAEETILGHTVSGPYGKGDMLQVLQLFQYVETFLRIYDADFNETIELAESLEAYRKYGPTLSRLLSKNGLPPDDVLAFFTFMMKYGETPFSMFGGQIRFNHWRWHRKDWDYRADRATLMSILNQLSKL